MRYFKEFLSSNNNPALGKSVSEKAKALGKQWKELNAVQKQPYEDAYKRDRVSK